MKFDSLGLIVHLLGFVELCLFPHNWRGRYLDSSGGNTGETVVEILHDSISNRGACVRRQNDNFLLYNRNIYCYQCVEIFREHENVLLYRQTSCVHVRKFSRSLCAQIPQRSRFNMFVKANPSPTLCPFEKGMKFIYTDQSFGYCKYPNSSLLLNADRRQFRLIFRHCVQFAMLNNKEIDFKCVAQWKDGFDGALLVQLLTPLEEEEEETSQHPGRNKKKKKKINSTLDIYRCMKFSRSKDLVHVSLSSYWGCDGVWNSTVGPLVLEMSEDFHGWPPACCSFPDWLTKHMWQNLNGSLVIVARDRPTLDVLEVTSDTKVVANYRCLRQLDFFLLDMEYIYLTHSTHDWSANRQCLRLRKKSDNIAIFAQGRHVEIGAHSGCYDTEDQYIKNEFIIVDQQGTSIECPRRNFYHTPPVHGCVHRVDLGCIESSVTHFEPLCAGEMKGMTLICIGVWREGEDHLSLVTMDFLSMNYYCFRIINSTHLVTSSRVNCGGWQDFNQNQREFLPFYNLIRNESCSDPTSDIYRERILKWTAVRTRQFPYGPRHRKSFTKDSRTLPSHDCSPDDSYPTLEISNINAGGRRERFQKSRDLSSQSKFLNLRDPSWTTNVSNLIPIDGKPKSDHSIEHRQSVMSGSIFISRLGDYDRPDHPLYIFFQGKSVAARPGMGMAHFKIIFALHFLINSREFVWKWKTENAS